MKKLLNILMAGIFALSSICPLAQAGDTTTNGYFYMPEYGATGEDERTSWFNSLEATDAVIGNMRSASFITQIPNSTLSGEQALSSLSTGLMKNANGTGVVSIATAGTDYEAALSTSSDVSGTISDESGSGALVFSTSPTLTTPTISGAMSFPSGTRQTFSPNATTPGLNVGSVSGDPSASANGDIWYDSTGGKFRCHQSGAVADCIGSGGGAGSGTVNTGVAGYFGYYPSNGTTVDDQTALYLDSSNIGIGTIAPVGALNVVGNELRIGNGGTNTNADAAGELYVQGDLEADGTIYATSIQEGGIAVPNVDEFDASSELLAIMDDETGTGALVFGTTPTFTTNITTPLLLGGSAVGSSAEIRSTSGVGTTSNVKLTVGNNGGTTGLYVDNSGNVGIAGITSPSVALHVNGNGRFVSLANCDTIDTDANGNLACGSDAGGANGWTDDGTTVRLSTSTDGLAVGTATEAGKFTIDGDADEVQASIQGNATQTTDIMKVEKSDGTRLFTVENANVGIGTTNPEAFFGVGPSSEFSVDNAGAITAVSISVSGTGLSALNQGLVVNENGGNTANDLFRVEGDGDTNLIYTDVTNDRVGIGTLTIGSKLLIEQVAAADSFRVNDAAADTTPFIIDAAGNVGIGSTTAGASLAVGSTGQFTVSSAGAVYTTASLRVPNGANPSVATAGFLAVDTSATSGGMLRFYDTAERAIPGYYSKSFAISGATTASDYPIWKTPWNITIRAIHVMTVGGTNVIGGLDECDGNAASCGAIDADITGAAGTNANDDGSLTNGTVDANDYVYWHTTSVSGTNTSVTVTFEYTVDPVN